MSSQKFASFFISNIVLGDGTDMYRQIFHQCTTSDRPLSGLGTIYLLPPSAQPQCQQRAWKHPTCGY